jgi:hypothetical protein
MLRNSFRFLLITMLVLAGLGAAAQDKIYLVDGSIIQAKVKEINPRNIIYTRWENKDGAEYVISRREVAKIVFENGTEETISRIRIPFREPRVREATNDTRTGQPTKMADLGKNILAIAPLQMSNESPAGLGVHYERVLDKNGIFNLYLPIGFTFFDDQPSSYTSSMAPPEKKSRVFTYLYPGLKIYPAGQGHRLSYSVGPSFGLGFGTKYNLTRGRDSLGSVIQEYKEENVFKAGFMINNGLNLQPTKSFYLGLELGLGVYYSNNESKELYTRDEPMVQFNFKMGYRF